MFICSSGRKDRDHNASGSVKRDSVEPLRRLSPKFDLVEVHAGELFFCVESAWS